MNDKEKKPGNPWTRSLLIWVGILFALVLFVQMIDGGSRSASGQAMAYSEFVKQVDEGNVSSVTMATSANRDSSISGKLDSGEAFHTVAPAGSNIADKMIQKGVGVQVKAEESFCEVESVKAVSDIYAPVTGEVIAVNDSLPDHLETLSNDPYGAGWIARIKVTDDAALKNLMNHSVYQKQCAEESH